MKTRPPRTPGRRRRRPTSLENWTVQKPFATVSGGATCVFLPGYAGRDGNPVPIIVQKSDGGFPYSATDLAALYFRVQEPKPTPAEHAPLKTDWRADRVIYFTDSRQAHHFAMVFAAFRRRWASAPRGRRVRRARTRSVRGDAGRGRQTDQDPLRRQREAA